MANMMLILVWQPTVRRPVESIFICLAENSDTSEAKRGDRVGEENAVDVAQGGAGLLGQGRIVADSFEANGAVVNEFVVIHLSKTTPGFGEIQYGNQGN